MKAAALQTAHTHVVDMIRHLDGARVDPGWMADIAARATLFVELDPERPGAPYLTLAARHARDAGRAVAQGDAQSACLLAAAAMAASYQAELAEALPRWFEAKIAPKAVVGEKFTAGRRAGSVGKVRLAVRKALKRRPDATPAQIWEQLKAKPPKGMALFDTVKLGKYIESAGAQDTSYRSFCNTVSKERKLID